MQKVVYISNSRDFTEQTDINENKYLVRINKLLEEGWTIAQMNTQTVAVDPKLENYLHKETLVSSSSSRKTNKASKHQRRSRKNLAPTVFSPRALAEKSRGCILFSHQD